MRAVSCLIPVFLLSLTVSTGEPLQAQQGTITGQVTDVRTGQSVEGAQVQIPALQVGTLSRASGRFLLLNVPVGDHTVNVDRLGYQSVSQSVTVQANEAVVIDFEVEEVALALDEIVVTSVAGEGRRRAVGHSVNRVEAAELTEQMAVPDLGSLISGRSPGVVVLGSSGQAGTGPQLNIRGTTSLSLQKQPLIYIDGVRVNNQHASGPQIQGFGSSVISRLNDINPADIESIEVIKGPAASTLYGTEAANGLIQIITKRGQEGSPTVDVQIRQGGQWLNNILDHHNMTNYERDEEGNLYTLNMARELISKGQEPFRTGHTQGYQVSVRGGAANNVRYYAALSLDDEQGVFTDNYARRYSGRTNLDFDPHEDLEVNVSVGYGTGKIGLNRETNIWSTLTATSPVEYALGLEQQRPPHILRIANDDFQKYDRLTLGTTFRHSPTTWFNQRLVVGRDRTAEDDQRITERMGGELLEWYTGDVTLGQMSRRITTLAVTSVDYSASFPFQLNEEILATPSFGAQYYNSLTDWIEGSGREFPATGIDILGATGVALGDGDRVENATLGFFGQQQVAWRDQVFLTAAVRADDNSAFGRDFSWVVYPKAAATWVVSEADFWNSTWMDGLRLRAAYGQSGQQPQYFAAVRSYQPVPTGDGGSAVSPHRIGNPDLKPERTSELELGAEASLLNDRISLDLTYYTAKTTDGIVGRAMAPSTGFAGIRFANVAETSRRGAELLLETRLVETRILDWGLNVNFSWNETEILDLGEVDEIPLSAGSVTGVSSMRVGDPVGAWYWYEIVSADVGSDGIARNVMCDGGPEVGHQPVPCDEAPKLFQGRMDPKFEGSLTSRFRIFDNIRIHAMLDFKAGFHGYDFSNRHRCRGGDACRESAFPQEYDPRRIAMLQDQRLQLGWGISDMSFIKLREVSLTYTLPNALIGGIAERASFSLSARNLRTWTDYTGMDPETIFHQYEASPLHGRFEWRGTPPAMQVITTLRFTL